MTDSMHVTFLDSKFFSKFEGWKEEVSKFAPNFQNMLQNTMNSQLSINSFFQRRIKPTNPSLFEGLYG
jgi:hypothetical protein